MSKGLVRAVRSGGIVLTGAILATSGLYVVVYLARWEWNRAIICALIFVSALITLSTGLVLQSLRRVDHRLAAIERTNVDGVREVLCESNIDAAADRHFEWLRRSTNTTSVFVPVLLGTGALLSIIAYAIERIAGVFAGATLDARTAAILPLDLPLSTLGPERVGATSVEVPRRNRRPGLVAVVLVLALGLGGVEALRRVTQSREGELVGPGRTTLTIELHRKDLTLSPTAAAGALWVACQGRVPGNPTMTQAVVHDNHVVIAIDAALGTTGRARIIGCLEDFTIDRVLADVTAVDVEYYRLPADSLEPGPLPLATVSSAALRRAATSLPSSLNLGSAINSSGSTAEILVPPAMVSTTTLHGRSKLTVGSRSSAR